MSKFSPCLQSLLFPWKNTNQRFVNFWLKTLISKYLQFYKYKNKSSLKITASLNQIKAIDLKNNIKVVFPNHFDDMKLQMKIDNFFLLWSIQK